MHGLDPQYQMFKSFEEEDKYLEEKLNELLLDENISMHEVCLAGRTNRVVELLFKIFK